MTTVHVTSPRNDVWGVTLSYGNYGMIAIFIECKNMEAAEKLRDTMTAEARNIIQI